MEDTQSDSPSLLDKWLPLVEQAWPLEWKLDREVPMILTGESGPLTVEIGEEGEAARVTVWIDDRLVLLEAVVATPEEAVQKANAAFAAKIAEFLAVPPLTKTAPDDATSARISPAMLEGGKDRRKGDTE
ncbi:MAG TPA: hypothetical protein VFS21_30670 [Roseiflexaceae bacterium]|nr:hypothetical protein [Roseiflexaceae bacterium]